MRLPVKISLFITMILMYSGCSKEVEKNIDTANMSSENFGIEISNNVISPMTELFNNADSYLDKNVVIQGEIIDVCPMRGCWIEVKDFDSEKSIRVKVKDGEIVFPEDSKNKQVLVEGIFSKIDFTEEQAIQWKIHLAEEKGIELASEDIELDASDLVEYRIKGLGAQITTKMN
ncbi:MAG TPA: DUF4920 domain-containing protein [Candidatus Marinimicrobia bacterium]|nr:DUF4920 domain-containing protein [Candidatus Neomarinimicrobiota bacterium]|tara:strand:- start:2578 stop:3099 length:522 start_codon:yes stop_codon:yes gene_type:complete